MAPMSFFIFVSSFILVFFFILVFHSADALQQVFAQAVGKERPVDEFVAACPVLTRFADNGLFA